MDEWVGGGWLGGSGGPCRFWLGSLPPPSPPRALPPPSPPRALPPPSPPRAAGLTATPFPTQGSEVNVIGIGTSVVTCPQQPSLGGVYKVGTVSGAQVGTGLRDGAGWGIRTSQLNALFLQLVAVGGQPRMKLTEDPEKQTLPGSKAAFRLLGSDGEALPSPLPSTFKAPGPPLILAPPTQGLHSWTCCS